MKKQDWHNHTIASDGEQTVFRLLEMAKQCSVESLSITDHDAVAAYSIAKPGMIDGVELTSGVELDCSYGKYNIEILGYGFNIQDPALTSYLTRVQGERRTRAWRYMERLNTHFGKVVLQETDVFPDGRVTILKPHIIEPLLEKKIFGTYKEAKAFLATVPDEGFSRATAEEAISMIQGAGGIAVLAHPGVYDFSHDFLLEMIRDLARKKLDGIETYYPYHAQQPERYSDMAAESAFVEEMRSLADELGLRCTRGGDSHEEGEFLKFNGK